MCVISDNKVAVRIVLRIVISREDSNHAANYPKPHPH